jgi:hypothetical protein
MLTAAFAVASMLAIPQAASALPNNPCTVMAVQWCTSQGYPRGSAAFLSCQTQIEDTCPFDIDEPPPATQLPYWCWVDEYGFHC